ncbi:MAG: choice-of-anchor D domain-containing protein [Verrucomicrobiota bacterium]
MLFALCCAAAAASAALLACGDEGLTGIQPDLQVKSPVDFGPVNVGATAEKEIDIENTVPSSSELDISSATFEGDDAGDFAVVSRPDKYVKSGKNKVGKMKLSFSPTRGDERIVHDYSVTLVINSNAKNGQQRVEVRGEGAKPDLELQDAKAKKVLEKPFALDFGEVGMNTTGGRDILVLNRGTGPLTVSNVKIAAADADVFRMLSSTNFVLQPSDASGTADETRLSLQCVPQDKKEYTATLTIESDDPETPQAEVALYCKAVESGCPIAVPKISGVSKGEFTAPAQEGDPWTVGAPVSVDLDGSESWDPEGDPVTYRWYYETAPRSIPEGSNAGFDSIGGNHESRRAKPTFNIDLVGEYTLYLEVLDNQGNRGGKCQPAALKINAVPSQKVHIELLWSIPRADLDLHLINTQAASAVLWSTPCDCYWNNRVPDWGVKHSDPADKQFCLHPATADDQRACDDDPTLDIDTTHQPRECTGAEHQKYSDLCAAVANRDCEQYITDQGVTDEAQQEEIRRLCDVDVGPENINIVKPVKGLFRILVHYFDGVYPTDARVRVFLNGIKAHDDLVPQRKLANNDLWDVGLIEWPETGDPRITETNAVSAGVTQESGLTCTLQDE